MAQNVNNTLSSGDIIYDFSQHEWGSNMEEIVSALLLVFTCILVLCLVISHYIGHRWHSCILPEAAAVLLVGLICGGLLNVTTGMVTSYLLSFSPTIFFIFFLPPIIFNSAYHMKNDFFFSEFKAIVVFATVGTIISALSVAVLLWVIQYWGWSDAGLDFSFPEMLTFGGLISATDPVSTLAIFSEIRVDPTLYYIVLGESLVNDAVGLVLFRTFSKFVGYSHGPLSFVIAILDFGKAMIGSVVIGYLCGCMSAYILRKINLSQSPVNEIGVYITFAYTPFLVSECFGFSGIVTVLASGMTMRRYAHVNLSTPKVREIVDKIFQLAAQIAETSVFLNLGLTVFNFQTSRVYNVRFIFTSVMACLISRAVGVFGLSSLLNCYRRTPLTPELQTMIWFAGLRGAVAFACATLFPDNHGHRHVIIASTMIIILCTVFIQGSLTKRMIDWLSIERNVDYDSYHSPPVTSKFALSLLKFERFQLYPLLMARQKPRLSNAPAGAITLRRPSDEGHNFEQLDGGIEMYSQPHQHRLATTTYEQSPRTPDDSLALGDITPEEQINFPADSMSDNNSEGVAVLMNQENSKQVQYT